GNAPVAGEPGADVLQRHADVRAQARFGNRGLGGELKQVLRLHAHVVALAVDLVRLRHDAVEYFLRDRHQAGMRDPRAVETVVGFAFLVRDHLRDRRVVRDRIVLDRNLRGHPAHRVSATAMAGLHQQLAIGAQEGTRHRDQPAIGEYEVAAAQLLDAAEDVIPAPAVEPGRVVAKLVEDLIHFERGGQRLDQYRRLDGAARQVHAALGLVEDVIPQARFEVAFDLRQVEIRSAAVRNQLFGLVEEGKPEGQQRSRYPLR